MKFVKQLSEGAVTIKDNEVVRKSVDEKSDEWASEFIRIAQENLPSSQVLEIIDWPFALTFGIVQ